MDFDRVLRIDQLHVSGRHLLGRSQPNPGCQEAGNCCDTHRDSSDKFVADLQALLFQTCQCSGLQLKKAKISQKEKLLGNRIVFVTNFSKNRI